MRLLIQRVKNASVSVGGVELSRIGQGLLVLVGVGVEDMTKIWSIWRASWSVCGFSTTGRG